MSLPPDPVVKMENSSQDDMKLDSAPSPSADDPYAAAAQALEQAQRAMSVARAAPRPATISPALVESLRAEITALKASSEREIAASKDAHDRESAELRAQMDALQTSIADERAALKVERETLARDRALLATERAAFEAEYAASRKALVDDRKRVVQGLHRMIQYIQPDPFPTAAQPASLVPTSSPAVATPPETGSTSAVPSRRAAEAESGEDGSPPHKRARTEEVPPSTNTAAAAPMATTATPAAIASASESSAAFTAIRDAAPSRSPSPQSDPSDPLPFAPPARSYFHSIPYRGRGPIPSRGASTSAVASRGASRGGAHSRGAGTLFPHHSSPTAVVLARGRAFPLSPRSWAPPQTPPSTAKAILGPPETPKKM